MQARASRPGFFVSCRRGDFSGRKLLTHSRANDRVDPTYVTRFSDCPITAKREPKRTWSCNARSEAQIYIYACAHKPQGNRSG